MVVTYTMVVYWYLLCPVVGAYSWFLTLFFAVTPSVGPGFHKMVLLSMLSVVCLGVSSSSGYFVDWG